ncbi:hypothetical protein [Ekhidna sp.]|uniref:hypothetical protein n=1 Tax=Ekhidna sp. TaxID=2608089 RepID=UPI003CCBC1AD
MQRILILVVFVYASATHAQIKSQVYIDSNPQDALEFADSLALSSYLNQLQLQWINQGYFFSGVDSILNNDGHTNVYLHKGERFKSSMSDAKGRQLQQQLSKELKSYLNNGYPFATISLDSLRIRNEKLYGSVVVKPGPKIIYDSAYFFNPVKTNHSYIYELLDIVPGEPFSERSYQNISRKIERAAFLQINRPPDLSFRAKQAKVFLDISENTSNTFQGVLGLQQSGAGNTSFVGNINLDIQNLFRSGKKLRFAWERFSEQSQTLDINYKHPFIFGSRISPSFRLNILKQDTTFLTRLAGIGINTYISPTLELFFEYEQTNGTLLSTDIAEIEGLADFTRNVSQIMLIEGNPNKLEAYTADYVWSLSLGGGRKKVEKNVSLPDTYYDSIQLNTDFYRIESHASYQLKVLKRQTFFHSLRAGFLSNDDLLRNELYRLGGLSTLRGFNEKSIFASSYLLSRMEFRSFFEDRSYAFVFYDQLFYRRSQFSDQPFGLGLGFSLVTSSGQFSFAFAVGDSKSQPISFSTMKAHFGYIARF